MNPSADAAPPPFRILIALLIVNFIPLVGGGIVSPLLPIYASEWGASGFMIGLVFSSFSISRTILLPYFGRLSDRRGRKKLIIIGLSINALCAGLYLMSSNPMHLVMSRFIQGISAAMSWPIATAYVGDIAPEGQEGAYMGWFNMATFGGLAAGPFIGGSLKDLWGMDSVFWAMGLIGLIGLITAAAILPTKEPYRAKVKGRPPRMWPLLKLYVPLRGLFAFRFFYSICLAFNWSFQPLYLDHVIGLPGTWIGALVSLNVAVSSIMQPIMGRIADRWSRTWMLIIGGSLAAMVFWMVPRCSTLPQLLAVNIAIGLAGGISLPALQAMATDVGRKAGVMGSVMGVLFTSQSLGMMTGPTIAGAVFEATDFKTLYSVGALILIVGLIPVIYWVKKEPVPRAVRSAAASAPTSSPISSDDQPGK